MIKFIFTLVSFIIISATFNSEIAPVNSPEQEKATFFLEKGMKIQLVAAEPMVQDPVCISFDADGRLWVVEMRGYMSDIEGNNEDVPNGRIKVLEDTNADGEMDKSTIYLDSLVMPRALAIIPNGILVVENGSLWQALDTNNDLKADSKTLIDKDYAGSTAPEHAGNGLLLNLDSWYYNAKSKFRYKFTNNQWIKDSTEFRGQWGISHDNQGRLVYNYNWSQLHGDLVPANYLSRNKNHSPSSGIDQGLSLERTLFPARPTFAVNRGYIPGVLNEQNKLKEFTAACSPFVFRSNTLGQSFNENIFVCEPAGNLIRRNAITQNGVEILANDPNFGREFLASTDQRFRPVALASGPDGALYISDMYKGVIQHKLYITPYLKEQTIKAGLQNPINLGRIWRIVPENWEPKKPQKMTTLSNKRLVEKLSSSDGWQRDMAQKLLIDRQDKSIEKELTNMALKKGNTLANIHALWVLDGLQLSKPNLLLSLIKSNDIVASNTALRIIEPFAQKDKVVRLKLQTILSSLLPKVTIEAALQIALSSHVLEPIFQQKVLNTIIDIYGSSAVIRDAALSSLYNKEFALLNHFKSNLKWKQKSTDKEIFLEMLTTAIIKKGNPNELESILNRIAINNKNNNWQEKAILMGLGVQSSNISKPIYLEKEPMIFAKSNNTLELYQQEKLKQMFEWPGHIVDKKIKQNHIVLDEKDMKMFAKGRIQYLNTCSGCHGSDGKGVKRFAPTLAGSEWVIGDERRLALIILHGLEGAIEVKGKKYDSPEILPVMPAHAATLDDATITNILTYIRNEWGNNAGPLSKNIVARTRHLTQGRANPWSAAELEKHIAEQPNNQ
jgi:mono/diheme cytochrome c family protein/glucose/arabinose dehydrogenase